MKTESELELQQELKADHSGAKVREMLKLIAVSSEAVRARLRTQRPAAEFRAAEELAQALDASDRVLRQVWESMHGKRLH
jgi:hypothetical protein